MRIVSIKDFDINNGEGIRVSVWVSGCHFKCGDCHNSSYWDNTMGVEFSEKHITKVLELLEKDIEKDVSILGGEPLEPYNVEGLTKLCKAIKEQYPKKTIWLWTGNLFEQVKHLEIMNYLDVLIDGQFVKALYDDKLLWRGSSNQRVIDVQASLKQDQAVLYLQ